MAFHQPVELGTDSTSTIGTGSNRRATVRRAMHIMADITFPGNLTIVGHTMDMSIGGLRAEVPYMLQPGQECMVVLDLTHLGGPECVKLTAEVRHCTDNGTGRLHAGMQFKSVDADLADILETLF